MNIKIDFKSAQDIIKERGLDAGGKVQEEFPKKLLSYGEKRTPKQIGNLINGARVQDGGRQIYYPPPYARYLWHGVKMKGKSNDKKPVIQPDFNRDPNEKGELQFQGATMRGKYWLERTWQDDGNKILQELADMAGGRVK